MQRFSYKAFKHTCLTLGYTIVGCLLTATGLPPGNPWAAAKFHAGMAVWPAACVRTQNNEREGWICRKTR